MKNISSNYDFSSAKEEYRTFCSEGKHDIQIFAQPWYLDAVCSSPDEWRVIIYKENSKIVAAFPFSYTKNKYGFWEIRNPWQAKRLGLWIDYGEKKENREIEEFEEKIIQYIIEKIPPYDIFNVEFDSRFTNWRGLHDNGFHQETHYSYVIKKESVTNDYISSITKHKRKMIQQLQKDTEVRITNSYEDFWSFFSYSYQLRNRKLSYSEKQLNKLIKAAIENKAAIIYMAKKNGGNNTATSVLLKDSRRSYAMFGSFDPSEKISSRVLLTYHGIIDVTSRGLDYDFEGSMIPGVANYNRSFNSHPEPYFVITKYSDRMRLRLILVEIKSIFEKKLKSIFKKND